MDQFKPSANLINFTSLTTAVSFLIVIAAAVFVLWPGFQELKAVRADIERGGGELQSEREYLQMLDEIKVELEENKEEIAKVNTALPSDPSVPSLFSYLQRTASESGLILTEINPFSVSSPVILTDLKEITFSVKISGPYASAKNFISTVERSARMIEIESISLTPSEEGSFGVDLRIKAFSY